MPWTVDKTTVKKTAQEILSEEVYIEGLKLLPKSTTKRKNLIQNFVHESVEKRVSLGRYVSKFAIAAHAWVIDKSNRLLMKLL